MTTRSGREASQYPDFAVRVLIDFDMIRIDRQLIDEIGGNGKSRILLKHPVNICREINAVFSLAGGIEIDRQRLPVKELACRYGQVLNSEADWN